MTRLKGSKSRDSYMEWIVEFPLLKISDDAHLAEALAVLERLIDLSKRDAGTDAYMDTLADLIESYEEQHHGIPTASDAAMLQHLLDLRGMSQAALHRETGIPKSSISEILKGEKSFTKDIVARLADFFQINRGILTANF
jgi:HTH-type transcriptional regulator/antitoxin HigA